MDEEPVGDTEGGENAQESKGGRPALSNSPEGPVVEVGGDEEDPISPEPGEPGLADGLTIPGESSIAECTEGEGFRVEIPPESCSREESEYGAAGEGILGGSGDHRMLSANRALCQTLIWGLRATGFARAIPADLLMLHGTGGAGGTPVFSPDKARVSIVP